MKYDMHTHTTYSRHPFWGRDALNTPEVMVKAAIKRGLSGMAITDHQTVKGSLVGKKFAKTYKKDFKIITGLEINTLSGDLLAVGVTEDVPSYRSVEDTIEKIHNLGGLAIAPHPYGEFGMRKCLKEESVKADAVEVFNATSCRTFQNNKAKELAEKYKKPFSAGSDAHYYKIVGNAGIICDDDPVEAIRKGKIKTFGTLTPLRVIAALTLKKYKRTISDRLLKSSRKNL